MDDFAALQIEGIDMKERIKFVDWYLDMKQCVVPEGLKKLDNTVPLCFASLKTNSSK